MWCNKESTSCRIVKLIQSAHRILYMLIVWWVCINGFTQMDFFYKNQLVTENGSFVLPNGVIVLVDEDIAAYLNGTLVFITKNTM